ncbi:ThuA domain-containing protein [Shouchella clausii]|uniref:ThuA domain-containing protein n=1 Tax=Shouchella clausii TaxID=79880 RepID=UPI00289F20F1|nr:ThuA domain-containing protein [Shouchella clausii]
MSKILVVYGGWKWHYPEETSKFTVDNLLGGYEYEVSDDLSILESNRLHEFDAIVLIWTQGELTQFQENSLVEAVENGLGLITWHGIADAFNNNHPFKMVLGGQFIAHPGNFIEYDVKLDQNDPLTRGINDFKMYSEQYYMHVDPNNEVVASTVVDGDRFTWLKGNTMPVAWKRQWGKGRVFYHSLGHHPSELEKPEILELTKRGIKWVVGND